MADSVEQLFAIATTTATSANDNTNEKCGTLGGIKNLQPLAPSASKTGASLKALIRLRKDLRSTSQTQLFECLQTVQKKDNDLLNALVAALAVAGRGKVQKTVLQFLDTIPKSDDSTKTLKSYLQMLAHNPYPSNVVKEVLVYFKVKIA